MINLSDCKVGDNAMFKDGSEAKIRGFEPGYEDTWLLTFDKKVRGIIAQSTSDRWSYTEDGRYDTGRKDGNDIVKIVRS